MRQTIRIGICEDQAGDRQHLTELIQATISANVQPKIEAFSDAESLLATFAPGRFDVLFLDMYLSGLTGIDAAKAIREVDELVSIVFTTVSPEFALDGYSVRAVHYLVKPVTEHSLREVWTRLRASESPLSITLMQDRKPIVIPHADILYAEAMGKLCRVHTTGRVIDTRLAIDQLNAMLPLPPFCRCHRGYIVNFDHVKDIGDDFTMDNGDTVYVRQTDRARIRNMYFESLVDKAKRRNFDVL